MKKRLRSVAKKEEAGRGGGRPSQSGTALLLRETAMKQGPQVQKPKVPWPKRFLEGQLLGGEDWDGRGKRKRKEKGVSEGAGGLGWESSSREGKPEGTGRGQRRFPSPQLACDFQGEEPIFKRCHFE